MNTENNTIELNGKTLQVHDVLFDFAIHQKASSNIDYFGTDYVSERLFVQFKGGTGAYIYDNIDGDLLDAAKAAESIGKFVLNNIVKKFTAIKFTEGLVKPIIEDNEPSF